MPFSFLSREAGPRPTISRRRPASSSGKSARPLIRPVISGPGPFASPFSRRRTTAASSPGQQSRELPGDELFDRIAAVATESHGQSDLEEARHHALLVCLKKLSEAHRDLLLSRYQDGTSLEHLSSEANLNRNAMAQKLFRIKQTLLRCVEKQIGAAKL
jgi:hypothetical protein